VLHIPDIARQWGGRSCRYGIFGYGDCELPRCGRPPKPQDCGRHRCRSACRAADKPL